MFGYKHKHSKMRVQLGTAGEKRMMMASNAAKAKIARAVKMRR